MRCAQARRWLALGAAAELDSTAAAALERHCATCAGCRGEAAGLDRFHALLARAAAAAASAPPPLELEFRRARMLAALPLQRPPARPVWPWKAAAVSGLCLGLAAGWLAQARLRGAHLAPLPANAVTGLSLDGDRLAVAFDPAARLPIELPLNDARVEPMLLTVVANTSNTGLRLDAIAALGGLASAHPAPPGDPALASTLLRALANDPNPGVRLQAIAALAASLRSLPAGAGAETVLAGLRAATLSDPNPGVRSRAIAAISAAPLPEAVSLLREIGAASPDADTRLGCAAALRRLAAPVPADWLATAGDDAGPMQP